jgi:hypothetical protein
MFLSQPSSVYEANHPTTKFIQKFVPGARLLEQIGSEVIYVLPTAGRDAGSTKHFEVLFTQLERYKQQMKIKSYGLSDTTLEEVNAFGKTAVVLLMI